MLDELERLKLRLMTYGIRVSDQAKAELSEQGQHPLTLAEYVTTSGITLVLGEDIWVNAPIADFNPNFVTSPSEVLDLGESGFVLRSKSGDTPAKVLPVPAYHDKRNDSAELYSSYAATHADRVRISPIEGCGIACSFCDLPYRFRYRRRRVDGLIDSLSVALSDKRLPARHVLISGGTPKPSDYDFERMVYRAVAERFVDVKVDVMMVPMPGLLDLRELKNFGIWGLSLNIELYDDTIARKIMPAKARLGSRHFLNVIEQAVDVFGSGRVRSLILVGLEPMTATLKGVRELASRGCEPVLSPFRPDPATPLRDHLPPSVDYLERTFIECSEIAAEYSVKLGPRCIPCQHNTLSFPDSSGYYYYS